MKKLLIFGGIIIAVFVLIFVLNSQKNKDALANNPYDTDNLKQSTIDLIDDPNYQNIIIPEDLKKKIATGEPVTAYFFSPECGYCKEMTPRLSPLAEKNDIEIVKYNVLEYEKGWNDYLIQATPTMIYFEDGKEVVRVEGAISNEQIQEFFDEVVLK
ncbi:thioredoxin family protein [Psychrobacillus psychrodurans]|uniref:Thioredoxin family protein n=1 Tax=Psychrobacillus psychrodurans TaxID=126157 RepID=A0A9X3R9J1_9BACI|nr:thioredoxin family protein [Psychrobacillus psychrodurans]MCZ8533520.1 thioredoxin family protein [Psychrobacillus psychrodurans]